MRWQDKLTKKELQHLRKEARVHTLIGFRRSRLYQEEHGKTCWECNLIAQKLGLEK